MNKYLITKIATVEKIDEQGMLQATYPDGTHTIYTEKEFSKEHAYEIKNNSITQETVEKFVRNVEFTTERIFGKLNTVMRYELTNGFVGIEASSCVDEKNYNFEIGKSILLKKLYDKIWFGLGFTLGMAQEK